jgi:type IV secretion system protein VirB4
MINLTTYRSKAKGLPDLLNIALLVGEPLIDGNKPLGIALNKSGSLMAGFAFAGPDIESSSEADLEALSAHLNHALARLGTGWAVHLDTIREPAPGYTDPSRCAFPDPVTAVIDAERRQQYTGEEERDVRHFLTRQIAVFSLSLPTDNENRFERALVSNTTQAETQLSEHISRFRTDMETLMSTFSGVARVTPLSSSDLLTHIHGCLTNDFHRINPPHIPAYLDAVLGAHDFIGGFEPKIDDQFIAVVGIAGFPPSTTPVVLESLNTLAIPFRFNLRFLFLDPAEAQKELTKYRRNWWQKRHGLGTQVAMAMGGEGSAFENSDAVSMAADADAAIAEASSGVVRYGFFTPVVVLHAPDRAALKDRVKAVRKHFDNLGFVSRLETINAVEAFLGSIPGHTFENVRRPLMSSLSLVDLAPTTSIWTGSEDNENPLYKPFYDGKPAPCLLHAATTGNTPFRFSLHVGDLGHTLIAGPTGSGKSVLLGLLAAQHRRYPNARIFAFDKGWSMYTLTNAAGGAHYDIGNEDAPLSFAPLSRVNESAAERAFAEEWIEALCVLQGVPVDALRRQRIHEAVEALAVSEQRGVNNLLNLLQDDELRGAVGFYASTGRAGALLSAETDSLDLTGNRFNTFELEHLMTGGDQSKLLVVPTLLYLFHRIEVALSAGDPSLIVLDEAWVMLDNPLFSAKIREWLKVLRKFNTAVIFATQSLADLQHSPLRPVLLESCPTKILLPNREAASQNLAPLYRDIGLNDHQIKLLQMSTPKSDYYVVSPNGRRRITLALGPVALAFLAVSSRKDVEAVRSMIAQHGSRWPVEWLRARLPRASQDWAEFAARLFDEFERAV